VDRNGRHACSHPIAHIEKLLAAGYARESLTGLVLTYLAIRRLELGESKEPSRRPVDCLLV
jgi:hypothetical protein